jgi:hypothetical protein
LLIEVAVEIRERFLFLFARSPRRPALTPIRA